MSQTDETINFRMSLSSNSLLPCNIKDSSTTETQAPRDSAQELPSIQIKPFGVAANLHDSSTKVPIDTTTKDGPNHTVAEKQQATASSQSKRNSWLSNLSNLSLKFTSTNHLQLLPSSTSAPLSTTKSTDSDVYMTPIALKYAVLTQAQRPIGDEPYTPALPRTSNQSFLQSAFRRLSNSNNMASQALVKAHRTSGICERRVLNVDKNRDRCKIEGLDQTKLRRVAFCVDVQVMEGHENQKAEVQQRVVKMEKQGKEKRTIKHQRSGSKVDAMNLTKECAPTVEVNLGSESGVSYFSTAMKFSKKKEKKKRNEEERKAKKERNKISAEASGRVPLQVPINKSETSQDASSSTLKQENSAISDPLRIYKRCCLLRETSALKQIMEQLADSNNQSRAPRVINRLDLTGHNLEHSDLITLGDFLALVPVNDLVMENCRLTDETVRIILAGLLSARHPDLQSEKSTKCKITARLQGGFVERVVLKNNPSIGRDGWQYICTFIALCRSLKSMDLSKISLPQVSCNSEKLQHNDTYQDLKVIEASQLLKKALSGRLGFSEFKLLNMAECGLNSAQIGNLVDGIIKVGLCRLGLAGNSICAEGMLHIARYLRNSRCEGLDLGGNDLRDQLGIIANVLTEESSLHSLSLTKCNLSSDSISSLLPALVNLKNFKFINLSNNPQLFGSESSPLPLFRRYLPQMRALKKLNLMSVSLTCDQAIALAEILPELPSLAYVNIMENPLQDVLKLSSAKVENKEEEACALYTSLMAAVRVSKTLVCVDIEMPSPDSSEVVKALAKQVVAYCLWNMEHKSIPEINDPDGKREEKDVVVPDILVHLVGQKQEEHSEGPEVDESTVTDEEYVISGSGVVKALRIFLSNVGDDSRQDSISDSSTQKISVALKADRAREMSKSLLNTAHNIRSRLQLVAKETKFGDAASYQRVISLDQTLETLIKRFEDEFPEIRRVPRNSSSQSLHSDFSQVSSCNAYLRSVSHNFSEISANSEASLSDDESPVLRPVMSRHSSDVSVVGRALGEEEGRMLRLSKQLKRENLRAGNGSDEEEKPLMDWSAPLDICTDIFEGGFGVTDGLLKQATLTNNVGGY